MPNHDDLSWGDRCDDPHCEVCRMFAEKFPEFTKHDPACICAQCENTPGAGRGTEPTSERGKVCDFQRVEGAR